MRSIEDPIEEPHLNAILIVLRSQGRLPGYSLRARRSRRTNGKRAFVADVVRRAGGLMPPTELAQLGRAWGYGSSPPSDTAKRTFL